MQNPCSSPCKKCDPAYHWNIYISLIGVWWMTGRLIWCILLSGKEHKNHHKSGWTLGGWRCRCQGLDVTSYAARSASLMDGNKAASHNKSFYVFLKPYMYSSHCNSTKIKIHQSCDETKHMTTSVSPCCIIQFICFSSLSQYTLTGPTLYRWSMD
jgi:hypothetical protein